VAAVEGVHRRGIVDLPVTDDDDVHHRLMNQVSSQITEVNTLVQQSMQRLEKVGLYFASL
jgi:hypothetical protein